MLYFQKQISYIHHQRKLLYLTYAVLKQQKTKTKYNLKITKPYVYRLFIRFMSVGYEKINVCHSSKRRINNQYK